MSSPPTAKKLLLIGWDAADWKMITPLMDAGLMPNLARLVESGVMGNLATLRPCLSPILWTSIATGKLADKHGILGFIEPTPDGQGVQLSSSTSRKTKAIWNILSQNSFRTHVVGWYASHPAEPISGVCVADQFFGDVPEVGQPWKLPAGAVHPESLADDIALLRVHPAELGPGDLSPFVPRLAEIDAATDSRVGKLAAAIAKTASAHAMATAILDAEPWDVLAVYYDAIDTVGHTFMPYHPPRLPTVSERDFELYRDVMSGVYRFHDMLLGRLMEMVGDETAIVLVSDHGFHCDHLRPATFAAGRDEAEAAALWHRHFGVLVMRGPGLKRDERVYGATLLDILPTILTMLGLPIGSDMDGRVLMDAFEPVPGEIRKIKSWDDETGPRDPGMHPADRRSDPFAAAAAIRQLVDLGYLPPAASSDVQAAVRIAETEAEFNLGVVLTQSNRPGEARAVFENLFNSHPHSTRYGLALAHSLASLGSFADCREVIRSMESRGQRTLDGDLLLVGALFHDGQIDAADARLAEVQQRYPSSAGALVIVGGLHAAHGRPQRAIEAYRAALALDDDNEQAHHGLSRVLCSVSEFEDAAEHALRAVGLVHHFPAAHYQLGVALEGMGELPRAIQSMEAAVCIQPGYVEAHRHLSRLYRASGQIAQAMNHERAAAGYGPGANRLST